MINLSDIENNAQPVWGRYEQRNKNESIEEFVPKTPYELYLDKEMQKKQEKVNVNINKKAIDDIPTIPDFILAEQGYYTPELPSWYKDLQITTPDEEDEWRAKGKMGIAETWQKKKKWEMIPYGGTSAETTLIVKNAITLNKIKKGEKVSEVDKGLLVDFLRDIKEEEVRGGHTWLGNALSGLMTSIPYIGEFAAAVATMPEGIGFAGLTKTLSDIAAKKAAKKAIKAEIKRLIVQSTMTGIKKNITGATTKALYKNALKEFAEGGTKQTLKAMTEVGGRGVIKEIAKATPKAAYTSTKAYVTRAPHQFVKGVADKQLSTGVYVTDAGNAVFLDSENIATSIMKSLASGTFDYMTETMGWAFAPITSYFAKPVRNILPKKFFTEFEKLVSSRYGMKATEAFRKYGYDGVIDEMGEELLNRFLCQVFGVNGLDQYTLDGFLNNVLYADDPSQWASEALSFAAMSGGGHLSYGAYEKYAEQRNIKKIKEMIDANAAQQFGYRAEVAKKLQNEFANYLRKNPIQLSKNATPEEFEKKYNEAKTAFLKDKGMSVEEYYLNQGFIKIKGSQSLAEQELRKKYKEMGVDDATANEYFNNASELEIREQLKSFYKDEEQDEEKRTEKAVNYLAEKLGKNLKNKDYSKNAAEIVVRMANHIAEVSPEADIEELVKNQIGVRGEYNGEDLTEGAGDKNVGNRSIDDRLSEIEDEFSKGDIDYDRFAALEEEYNELVELKQQGKTLYQDANVAGAESGEYFDAAREWQEKGTDSSYFKKWFGDSKVVDEEGKPLVVYHGTENGSFEVFSEQKVEDGFFFTDDINTAKEYAEVAPFLAEDMTEQEIADASKIYEVYLKMENPYIADMGGEEYRGTAIQGYIDEAKELGHDGLIIKNIVDKRYTDSEGSLGTDYIVFNPEQIKSVDNRGTFDAENPNIYYQRGQYENPDQLKFNFDAIQNNKEIPKFIPQSQTSSEQLKFDFDALAQMGVEQQENIFQPQSSTEQSVKEEIKQTYNKNDIKKANINNEEIVDTGDSLLGNLKKDKKQYTWEELDNMNDLLRKKYLSKSYIYQLPSADELRKEKLSDRTIAFVYLIYSKINARPAKGYDETKEHQKIYFDGVHEVMQKTLDFAKKNNDLIANYSKTSARNSELFDMVYPDYNNKKPYNVFTAYPDLNKKAIIVGGNKLVSALQLGYSTESDITKALILVDKEKGTKTKTENNLEGWEKKFEVAETYRGWCIADRKSGMIISNRDLPSKEIAEQIAKQMYEYLQKSNSSYTVDYKDLRNYIPRRENNQNVKPEALIEVFGFRGINFGNWTKQSERQDFLNLAYDSLHDLAELLKLPPKALSLDGKLGLAFGAQGRSKAAGHFIPEYNEINLTRKSGAGSLAHEWWHALDFYFGDLSLNKDFSGKSALGSKEQGQLRPEIFNALKNLEEQIKYAPLTEKELAEKSTAIEQGAKRNLEYWANDIKKSFAKSKNADKIAAFVDKIVKNAETIDTKNDEELRHEYYELLDERRRTWENLGKLSNLEYQCRKLQQVKELAAASKKYSKYFENAKLLNTYEKGMGSNYWTSNTELGARAFASYILDKISKQNFENGFLVRDEKGEISFNLEVIAKKLQAKQNGEEYKGEENSIIEWYPAEKDERKRIFAAFDDLFNTIQYKQTDRGYKLYQPDAYNEKEYYNFDGSKVENPLNPLDYDYITNDITGEKIKIEINEDINVDNIKTQKISSDLPFKISSKPSDNKKELIKNLNLNNNQKQEVVNKNTKEKAIINKTTIEKSLSNIKIANPSYNDFCSILFHSKKLFEKAQKILSHNDRKNGKVEKIRRYANIAKINKKQYLLEFVLQDNGEILLYSIDIIKNEVVSAKRLQGKNLSAPDTTNNSIAHIKDIFKSKLVNKYNKDYQKAVNNSKKFFQSAYSGGAADYDIPSLDYIGTGEGAQAHGWGLYYAENKDVAEGYRKRLSSLDEVILYKGKSPKYIEFKNGVSNTQLFDAILYRGKEGVLKHLKEKMPFGEDTNEIINYVQSIDENKLEKKAQGQVFKVDIPDANVLLDEKKDYKEQSKKVKKALIKLVENEVNAPNYLKYNLPKNENINMDGRQIYNMLSRSLGGDKKASETLNKYGIKGITYDGLQDGRCYVVFDDKAVKVLEKYYQDLEEQENLFFNKGKADNFIRAINHRGAYIPAEKIIELYKNADASTFLHEMAHWYLDLLSTYAKDSEALSAELEEVRKWLKNDGGEFTREQHEKFARGFEAYIRSGYAKNNKLKKVFEYFKNFLLSIYHSLKQLKIEEEEMPQIVELFDKLLSTEKERIRATVFDKISEIDEKIAAIKENEAKEFAELDEIYKKNIAQLNRKSDKKRSVKEYLELAEKMTSRETKEVKEYKKRYKDATLSILSEYTGKPKTWVANSKNWETLQNIIANGSDKITISGGLRDEWAEFYSDTGVNYDTDEVGGSDELARQAFDVLADGTFNKVVGENYEFDEINKFMAKVDYLEAKVRTLKGEEKEAAVEALFSLFNKMPAMPNDVMASILEKIDKIAIDADTQQKDDFNARVLDDVDVVFQLQYFITKKLNDLKVYNPETRYKMRLNKSHRLYRYIKDVKSVNDAKKQIRRINKFVIDDMQNNQRGLLHKEIQKQIKIGAKVVKVGSMTKGKFDWQTNTVFAELVKLNKLTREQAEQELGSIIQIEEAAKGEDRDSYNENETAEFNKTNDFQDRLKKEFIQYRSMRLQDLDVTHTILLLQDILELKEKGRQAKSEEDFINKTQRWNTKNNLLDVLDVVKQSGAAFGANWVAGVGKGTSLNGGVLANWESLLNAIFNKDTAQKYSLLSLEAKAEVYARKHMLDFYQRAGEIYGFKQATSWDKFLDYDYMQPLIKLMQEYNNEKYTYRQSVFSINSPDGVAHSQIEISRAQMITMFAWSLNEKLEQRLFTQFGISQIREMFEEVLSEQDRQLAWALVDTCEGMREDINEVFIRTTGLSLPAVENYFPSKAERVQSDIDMYHDFFVKSSNPSFIKERKVCNRIPMKPMPPLEILIPHINKTAKYVVMSEHVNFLNQIFKDTAIKTKMQEIWGSENGAKIYQTLINKLAACTFTNYSKGTNLVAGALDTLSRNYITSAVGFSPKIAIGQLLSVVNYAENMPSKEWIKGFTETVKHPVESFKYMVENCEYLQTRLAGNSQNEVIAILTSEKDKFRTLRNFMTANVKWGDIIAIALGGKPYVDYLMQQGMTQEEAFEKFVEDTLRAQQAGTTSSISEWQAEQAKNCLTRMFFAFRNATIQYERKFVDTLIQAKKGDIDKHEAMKKIFIYKVFNPFMFTSFLQNLSIVALISAAFRGDDPDDTIFRFIKSAIQAVLLSGMTAYGFAGYIASALMESLIAFFDDEYKHFESDVPIMSDFEKQTQKFLKGDLTVADWVDALAWGSEIGLGLPSSKVVNTVEGMGDVLKGNVGVGLSRMAGWGDYTSTKAWTGEAPEKKKKRRRK